MVAIITKTAEHLLHLLLSECLILETHFHSPKFIVPNCFILNGLYFMNLSLSKQNLTLPTCSDNKGSAVFIDIFQM